MHIHTSRNFYKSLTQSIFDHHCNHATTSINRQQWQWQQQLLKQYSTLHSGTATLTHLLGGVHRGDDSSSWLRAVILCQRCLLFIYNKKCDLWHVLSTLKRTITKSTLNTVEGTTYLCALCQHIVPGARATSTTTMQPPHNCRQHDQHPTTTVIRWQWWQWHPQRCPTSHQRCQWHNLTTPSTSVLKSSLGLFKKLATESDHNWFGLNCGCQS